MYKTWVHTLFKHFMIEPRLDPFSDVNSGCDIKKFNMMVKQMGSEQAQFFLSWQAFLRQQKGRKYRCNNNKI